MNEKRAIALCLKHHDPAGFEHLFKAFRKEAYYHAIAFLGNHEDAVDACQECFAQAFQAIPKLDSLKAFYPWFYTILRNHCMNMLRKRNVASEYALKESVAVESQYEQTSPAFLAEKGDEQLRIWQTMERLTPEFREILVMKYIEGLCYQEISVLLGIPRGTVMSRLYNARKAFKKEYVKSDLPKGGDFNE
jgi:RNA polymerase sigma-70 factor (ECF subfamily)